MGKLFYPKCSQTNSRDVKVSIGTLHGTFFAPEAWGDNILNCVNFSLKIEKNRENAPFRTSCHPASNYIYKSAWCSHHRNIKETKLWTFYTVKTDFHAARHFLVFLPRVPISVEFMMRWGYYIISRWRQSVECDCGEPQTMAHLLSCRLLDEACTADDLATVTERVKACPQMGEHCVKDTKEEEAFKCNKFQHRKDDRRLLDSHFVVSPTNSMSPSNDERVMRLFFFKRTKPFIRNNKMHKMKALWSAILISYSFIDVCTV